MAIKEKSSRKLKRITAVSLYFAIFVLSSYIHIPSVVPFTLQTAALAFGLEAFGCIMTFQMLFAFTLAGFAGIPVFSGLGGGLSVLAGPSGGFIIGFFVMTGFYGIALKWILCFKLKSQIALVLSLLPLYLCASLWYTFVYLTPSFESFCNSMLVCVAPYAAFDILKVLLGSFCAGRIKKVTKLKKLSNILI